MLNNCQWSVQYESKTFSCGAAWPCCDGVILRYVYMKWRVIIENRNAAERNKLSARSPAGALASAEPDFAETGLSYCGAGEGRNLFCEKRISAWAAAK